MHPTTIKRTISTVLGAAAIMGGASAPAAHAIAADAWPRPTTRVHTEPPPSPAPRAAVRADAAAGIDVPSAAIGAAGTGVVFLVLAAGLTARRTPQF